MTVINFAEHQRLRPASNPPCYAVLPLPRNDRKKRSWLWRKEEMRLDFLKYLRGAASYAKILYEEYDLKDGEAYIHLSDSELLDSIRDAQAMLLLADVSRKTDLEKKHRIMKQSLPYLDIGAALLTKQLQADAAYLAIPRGARKAVQS